MARYSNSIPMTGMFTPYDSADNYAITSSEFQKGGWHEVASLADRDAIPAERRSVGMIAAVADVGDGRSKVYQLIGGVDNAKWVDFVGGSGGSGGSKVVETLVARDEIPADERYEGMQVLVYNEPTLSKPTTYMLIGGIDNENWVAQEIPVIDPNTAIYKGEWKSDVVYSKGHLVTAPFANYITASGGRGNYSQKALLVCKADASTVEQPFAPLTEFDLIAAFDIGNHTVNTSATHGLVYAPPIEGSTNDYEVGNLVLISDQKLLLCNQNIDSTNPLDESESGSWLTLVDFTKWYTKTEIDALLTDAAASVTEVADSVTALTAKVETNETSISELADKVEVIETNTSVLSNKVEANEIAISEINTKVTDLEESVTSIENKIQYCLNDFIVVSTVVERDALNDAVDPVLVKHGTVVLVANDPTLGTPTTFIWDGDGATWVKQDVIDPNTAVYRGEYDTETEYKVGDIVTVDEVFYISKTINTDSDPTEEDSEDWIVFGGKPEVFTRTEGTYVTVGGITAGTDLSTLTWPAILEKMLYPFLPPSFETFTIQGQNTSIEVGNTIPAGLTFAFTTKNTANINTEIKFEIKDITGDVVISNTVETSPAALTHTETTRATSGNQVYRITGTNTQSELFSKNYTIEFKWAVYMGESEDVTLDGTGITSLRGKTLNTTGAGTYIFPNGGYKYICYPTTFGQLSNFKDKESGFKVAMKEVEVIEVTNEFGISQNYYVHRTLNSSAAGITIIVE